MPDPTEYEQCLHMLLRALIPFEARAVQDQRVIEVDGGNGALACFAFDATGALEAFAIDKDAY